MIILDTNVISELMRPAPDATVARWVEGQPPSGLFTTAISEAEIRLGIDLLPRSKRRSELLERADLLFGRVFAGRILPFDSDAARALAGIGAERRRLGRPINEYDGQIAAIALSRGAGVATRDTAGFSHCGVTVIDPRKR